jgi:hypothetical protein
MVFVYGNERRWKERKATPEEDLREHERKTKSETHSHGSLSSVSNRLDVLVGMDFE